LIPHLVILLLSFVITPLAFCQDKDGRAKDQPIFDQDGFEIVYQAPTPKQLDAINQIYLANVKPIFAKKCFDCHATTTHFPWYYHLPGVKNLIDYDIAEAKSHMDMTNDFPFMGHGSAKDDLKAIADSTKEGNMPPLKYSIIHWGSRLQVLEKKAIIKWTEQGQDILSK